VEAVPAVETRRVSSTGFSHPRLDIQLRYPPVAQAPTRSKCTSVEKL
jgi:hypothetical protein